MNGVYKIHSLSEVLHSWNKPILIMMHYLNNDPEFGLLTLCVCVLHMQEIGREGG